MRIIAGRAKGTRLVAPQGRDVRPTLDRVREALFSILTPYLDDCTFLDLYAGTGANGIEALSRGAARATFVDNDARAIDAITRNLAAARLTEFSSIRRLNLPNDVSQLKGTPYNIIFCDPPYAKVEYSILLEQIAIAQLVAPEGIVVIEHASKASLPDNILSLNRFRTATYGDTGLSFFT